MNDSKVDAQMTHEDSVRTTLTQSTSLVIMINLISVLKSFIALRLDGCKGHELPIFLNFDISRTD
jgi:hypothetical protein